MKKIKLNGKLSLNKETIAKLNDEQMNNVKGGFLSIGNRCSRRNACARLNGRVDCPKF
jgi:natural product precursor